MKGRSSRTARALWFLGPGQVALREEPVRPGPGQVLVRSRLIGISHGTERLAFRGWLPPDLEADATLSGLPGTLRYPLKYGYINVGETETGRRVFAFVPHQDLFAADPGELIGLPDGLPYEDALFLANMETAVGIAHDVHPRFGEAVLVVGQGVVGLLAAAVLRRCGADPVITLDRFPLRREASRRLGCRDLPAEAGAAERIRRLTAGRGVDLAVDVSASEEGLQTAIDALAFEGTVVEASWFGTRRVGLDLGAAFHRKRLRIRASQVSHLDPALAGRWDKGRRIGRALALLAELRPSRLITHRFPLAEAQAAFELLDGSPDRCIQVVLEP